MLPPAYRVVGSWSDVRVKSGGIIRGVIQVVIYGYSALGDALLQDDGGLAVVRIGST